jgi:type I restriction enzyme S subunit
MREDWIEVELGETFNITYGKGLSTKDLLKEGYPVYGANGVIGYYSDYKYEERQVLISCRGAASGKINISPEKCFITNNSLIVESSGDFISKEYLYFILSGANRSKIVTGSAQPQVTINNANPLIIKLAPLPIQRAIVSKIEALFSDLDNGIASFKKAQEQLKIYRQALLKKAFEGELTKEWREKQSKLPTAEELLKDNSDNLPKRWKMVKLGEAILIIEAGKSFRCDERPPENDEVGVLKVSAVTWGEFSELESKTIISDDKVNLSYFVKQGDFLFSRANTLELVGRSVIVKNIHKKLMLSDKTLRFKFSEAVNSYYILYFLRTQNGRKQIETLSTGNQISMRNIGQGRIKEIIFPLCSLPEQNQIVQEIEFRFSVCDKMEQSLKESIEKAEALRQSILKEAFEGKLLSEAEIEQCKSATDYEPASVLLKKIKAEKLAKEQEKKNPTIKKKSKK